jgi:hypothetical protein
MAWDWPDAPTSGNEFTPPNGPTYVYDGVAWRRKGGSASMPTPPPLGGVIHDATLTGDGTAASPLSIAIVDAGTATATRRAR